jgi:hypothetical protein
MRRLLLVATLVTALLLLFAGSALADGPYGYGTMYGSGYNPYSGAMRYQPYGSMYHYCCYSMYARCPYMTNYGYTTPKYTMYGYGSYSGYMMYGMYGMYGTYSAPNRYAMYGRYGY